MRVLNLYAGIGGNRKLWGRCVVTAVEINQTIAGVYRYNFPYDKIVVGDAHQYLLDHYAEFDFIWSSPPCQSHSSFRQNIGVRFRGSKPLYPDMNLYQEILFLKYNFKGLWVVENVRPYYKPLIEPNQTLQRHPFWSNFDIPHKEFEKDHLRSSNTISSLEEKHGFSIKGYNIPNKRQILRNCVAPKLGFHILEAAVQSTKEKTEKD